MNKHEIFAAFRGQLVWAKVTVSDKEIEQFFVDKNVNPISIDEAEYAANCFLNWTEHGYWPKI